MRYFSWCDESVSKGEFYSDFYGGALINSKDFELIKSVLEHKRTEVVKTSELKWQKISHSNYKHYIETVDCFFDFIQADKIKLRLMFTNNRFRATGLTTEQKSNFFLLLYYQFLKHSFGLKYLSATNDINSLSIFFDHIPDTTANKILFKKYVKGLESLPEFINAKISIAPDEISEVDSSKHIVMQCLDIVLGAMAFKLNKMDIKKREGTNKRGKRTMAKAKVFKHIYTRINKIYPNFSINQSTSTDNDMINLWKHPYRHWVFKPVNYEFE
jgi:hypothetical protein